MKINIFLTTEDKKKIIKLAQAKNISFSCCCGIIIDNLHTLTNWHDYEKNAYIKKGENNICIKIRDVKDLTCSVATNCIYQYLHEEVCKFNIKQVKKRIQSEMDKKIDRNVNKAMEIRIAWKIKKGKI